VVIHITLPGAAANGGLIFLFIERGAARISVSIRIKIRIKKLNGGSDSQ
jgi:hypothetical protein